MPQRKEDPKRQLPEGKIPAVSAEAKVAQMLIGISGEDYALPPAKPIAPEIRKVTKEKYQRLLEALKHEGIDFVVAIKPKSMGQLYEEDGKRPERDQKIGYVDPSETMRAITPPKMEVAFSSKRVRIKRSNNLSANAQKQMIAEEEAKLKSKLPEDLRDTISMIMPGVSVQQQMDAAYEANTGQLLYPDFFGRSDDETVPGSVADAGRPSPAYQFRVVDCSRDVGRPDVFAIRVVVLPQILDG